MLCVDPTTAGSVTGELGPPLEREPTPSPRVGDQQLEGQGVDKGQRGDTVQEEEREGWEACCEQIVFLTHTAFTLYIRTYVRSSLASLPFTLPHPTKTLLTYIRSFS